jgi:hypothetical protein
MVLRVLCDPAFEKMKDGTCRITAVGIKKKISLVDVIATQCGETSNKRTSKPTRQERKIKGKKNRKTFLASASL